MHDVPIVDIPFVWRVTLCETGVNGVSSLGPEPGRTSTLGLQQWVWMPPGLWSYLPSRISLWLRGAQCLSSPDCTQDGALLDTTNVPWWKKISLDSFWSVVNQFELSGVGREKFGVHPRK